MAVPIQGAAYATHPITAPIAPIVVQQPVGQPLMMAAGTQQGYQGFQQQGGHVLQHPVMVSGAPQVVAGNSTTSFPPFGQQGNIHADPVLGIGQTGMEVMAEQMQFAHENGLFDAQDFKPKDDDAGRYYMVRELDGTWTQRNRFTIDSLNCRWFLANEGYFYAVRVPES